MGKWRLVEFEVKWSVFKEFGFWQVVWGSDIFFNNIPVLKSLVLCNILVWVVLWVTTK